MDHLPIENLPEYLKNRNVGESGPVVDVGRIVVPNRPYMKWATAITMAMVLCVGGIATYKLIPQELTVVVDTDGAADISKIMSESEGQITAVKQTEGNSYEIKVSPRNKHLFLEWLRKSKGVKKAEEE